MADHQWENRWSLGYGYENPVTKPNPDRPWGWLLSFEDQGEPDYVVVSDLFGNDDYEVIFRGKTAETRAQALADEFNRFEWQGPLDPEYAERRKRLKRLAPNFGSYLHDGPPEARWPVRPGKYLIHDYGVGWHPEDFYKLVDDLEAVEAAIAADEANVGSVVDLDTGEEIAFDRKVLVKLKT